MSGLCSFTGTEREEKRRKATKLPFYSSENRKKGLRRLFICIKKIKKVHPAPAAVVRTGQNQKNPTKTTISAAYYSIQRKEVRAPGAETSGKICIWKESGVSEQDGARWW